MALLPVCTVPLFAPPSRPSLTNSMAAATSTASVLPLVAAISKDLPKNIDLVLLTHGHGDHVSGLVKDGKLVFPNAKVLFSEMEKSLYEDKAIESTPDQ